MPAPIDPIRPTDDEARDLAQSLIAAARFAALAVLHPETRAPYVSRIALGRAPSGAPVTLVSTLALHTTALKADPRAALLIGEPGPKGDPLTHPRLSLQARARFLPRDDPAEAAIREKYRAEHPKSKLYADFADFGFVLFEAEGAALNGGFGRAYMLTPEDLGLR
jgi:hypothetical protein